MKSVFEEMIDLARRAGIAVRHVRLGGTGGGLCRVRDGWQLFVDIDAPPVDQLEQTAKSLRGVREIEGLYVRPDVRELIDQSGEGC